MAAVNGSHRVRVELLGGFELRYDDMPVRLPMSAQRVLAFLALQERPVRRTYVAWKLWLESPEGNATSSLRSALWRLRRSGYDLVEAVGPKLRLAPGVAVDVREAAAWAHAVLEDRKGPLTDGSNGHALLGELLPDWYEDWVILERERLRELQAHALESRCEHLMAGGSYGTAMEYAQAAVKLDPLRESAHRLLIRIHLAEGNQSEALRDYRLYRRLLHDEVGLDPSMQMLELVSPLAVH
jgi:DNA-binding SARP family transcriptional activator